MAGDFPCTSRCVSWRVYRPCASGPSSPSSATRSRPPTPRPSCGARSACSSSRCRRTISTSSSRRTTRTPSRAVFRGSRSVSRGASTARCARCLLVSPRLHRLARLRTDDATRLAPRAAHVARTRWLAPRLRRPAFRARASRQSVPQRAASTMTDTSANTTWQLSSSCADSCALERSGVYRVEP
jgi:hypothetical protein